MTGPGVFTGLGILGQSADVPVAPVVATVDGGARPVGSGDFCDWGVGVLAAQATARVEGVYGPLGAVVSA